MNKGKRIRQKREELGISLTDFANKVGVSKQTLYKYEHNIVTNIPSDKLEEIAKALDVTPGYLMGWDSESITASGHDDIEIISVSSLPYTKEEQKAKELFELYKNASPDVQQAVELILKSAQSK